VAKLEDIVVLQIVCALMYIKDDQTAAICTKIDKSWKTFYSWDMKVLPLVPGCRSVPEHLSSRLQTRTSDKLLIFNLL